MLTKLGCVVIHLNGIGWTFENQFEDISIFSVLLSSICNLLHFIHDLISVAQSSIYLMVDRISLDSKICKMECHQHITDDVKSVL